MNPNCHFRVFNDILHILLVIPIIAILAISGCSNSGDTQKRLDKAESLMESHPDSALVILDSINPSDLKGRIGKARYALLKSIALDKNYIDTTTFDVLQPAIDYYLEKGTPDERLKTYYYKGCILNNAGNDDLAMQCFISGYEIKGITDSLTLARLLVAQGVLYEKQYKISDYLACNLRAGKIFESEGNTRSMIISNCYALRGAVILQDKEKSDSIAAICRSLAEKYPEYSDYIRQKSLNYIIDYGNVDDIKNILSQLDTDKTPEIINIGIAKGYARIGHADTALQYLNRVNISPENLHDSLSYLIIRSNVMDSLGNYRQSKDLMRRYALLLAKTDYELFSNELLFSEKKHEMEMSALIERQRLSNHKWTLIIAGFISLLALIAMSFKYHLTASKRKIAEQEAENLRLELGTLEEERLHLDELLKERPDMTPEMMKIIYDRLNMLNTLLAKEITSNDSYARSVIESIRKDREGFLASTRIAFSASNPRFMKYLENHSLTDEEINYVCLYAMGLRGKEIGEYIRLKRHYVMGSGIRKKLGINEHETNLGPYIRNLLKQLQSPG